MTAIGIVQTLAVFVTLSTASQGSEPLLDNVQIGAFCAAAGLLCTPFCALCCAGSGCLTTHLREIFVNHRQQNAVWYEYREAIEIMGLTVDEFMHEFQDGEIRLQRRAIVGSPYLIMQCYGKVIFYRGRVLVDLQLNLKNGKIDSCAMLIDQGPHASQYRRLLGNCTDIWSKVYRGDHTTVEYADGGLDDDRYIVQWNITKRPVHDDLVT